MSAQSRVGSMVETLTNTAVGMAINVGVNAAVLPIFGFYPSFAQNVGMTIIFTFVSIIRSYVLRRVFNGFSSRKSRA